MMNLLTTLLTFLSLTVFSMNAKANHINTDDTIRVATFNVSMEALNYSKRVKGQPAKVVGNELNQALTSNHQQIKNIAEIIQRVNPDIILLNEFDYSPDGKELQLFLNQYLNVSQQEQNKIHFPYYYQSSVNTGVKTPFDLNGDNKIEQPADTYGFGHFPGHFGMVLLSKYPINAEQVRSFQTFKWKDMPNALQPIDPQTGKSWYSDEAWQGLRLSSKSHWDIPVNINNKQIHILASHPTPPVFDGPEDRNGKRNHDEIRFWHDYISEKDNAYIYDDKGQYGGLTPNSPFIILGDLNASATEGDAINSSISALLNHDNVQDALPASKGAKLHSAENSLAKHHTAYWRMRADYVLPSKKGFNLIASGVFWPEKNTPQYRLIKDRQASSDHRLVWLDLEISE
ncbi:endonuclease/exonuclease/phosphatase family protein [Colwellia sp. 1_MG-2023]|uniref:endonuclease/exonuclease/phosphatase family protein n=1 Tax=Colwellia sp. 1_MG-2023 TaxID=3062649 RepID=UPI0026E2E153|nr:endonuclease/exonuclease/phosphatase family protein [Colwellia sp. 1_MG-2023]MDO6446810.1 endonuclease/exonuclease/phosphatase family protein [Colwellia sp. 1_MG-2023]